MSTRCTVAGRTPGRSIAECALGAVRDGRIRFHPEHWAATYNHWLEHIQDWCISRQLWWGHQIPAWYDAEGRLYVARSEAEALAQARARGVDGPLTRDPDVLDTWFSSALVPFSSLGWPDATPDLERYLPSDVLVTGNDIIFFWVARMVMMTLHFTGQVPFRDVYIHALVRDAEGQKMSKSKGNVIDPLHVMDQYGTDALRFTLASMASPGRDVKLAEERIEGYRNFANKIWNAARFILMHSEGARETMPPHDRPWADRWILSRLNATIQAVTQELDHYRFDQASGALYQFIWHEYCDWYLELAKVSLQDPSGEEAKQTRQTLVETGQFVTEMRQLTATLQQVARQLEREPSSLVFGKGRGPRGPGE